MINLIVFRTQVRLPTLAGPVGCVSGQERRVYLAARVNIGLWSGVASQMMTRHR